MKKFTILLLLAMFAFTAIQAQIAYSPLVDSLINQITEQSISDLNRKLSGEIEVSVGGQDYFIISRHSNSPYNPIAAEWIFDQFDALGLQVEYDYFNANGENVVATIPGSLYPDKQYIICGHYDDMPSGNNSPGADDNASGVVGVLEAARLLANMNPLYTIKFIAFDEEEQGLIGSYHYAAQASGNGDDILGVLNLDMIAYDSDSDYMMSISVNNQSLDFADFFIVAMDIYEPDMNYNYISTTASDHSPFWNYGYDAILAIEDWGDFNAYYHTPQDKFDNMNIPFFLKMTKVSVATLSSLALGYTMSMDHEPLPSNSNTDDRIATLTVQIGSPIPTGANEPRLYYSINNDPFVFINPFYVNLDTLQFVIPGQPIGTAVQYYFAVQDESGDLIATLPSGGSGVNPPGTTAPAELFDYFVGDLLIAEYCTQTAPKYIHNLSYTIDTITVTEEANVADVNVTVSISHPDDGQLDIYLVGSDGTEIELSTGNGSGGANYINTVFDDEAELSITQGSPPFMGTYKPEMPLSTYLGTNMNGDWMLKIYDSELEDEGVLANWCIEFEYYYLNPGIAETSKEVSKLYQNYPNPFAFTSTIGFEVDEPGHVIIDVFDIMGRHISTLTNKNYTTGNHLIEVNGSAFEAGRYFYRMQTTKEVLVKSMTVIK